MGDNRVIHLTIAEASLLKSAAQAYLAMKGYPKGRGRPPHQTASRFPPGESPIEKAIAEVRRQFEALEHPAPPASEDAP